jgi:hypothetical protein
MLLQRVAGDEGFEPTNRLFYRFEFSNTGDNSLAQDYLDGIEVAARTH